MDSLHQCGKICLFVDALLIVGFGVLLLLIPRRSVEGKRVPLPILPVLGAVVFAEITVLLIYLGIMAIARHWISGSSNQEFQLISSILGVASESLQFTPPEYTLL